MTISILLKKTALDGVNLNSNKDAEVLRGIKTLERINGKKVKDYWQEYDSKKKKGRSNKNFLVR